MESMSDTVMHSTDVERNSDIQRVPDGMSLVETYLKVRDMSQQLCAPLSVEDHCLQPMPDASPAKWHLAHTTWFFETFLLTQFFDGYRSFHPDFRNLFNSYYNTIGDRPLRALRHVLSRPSLDEVRAYRSYVDDAMSHLLTRELPSAALDLVTLGINHEQQHQELIVTDVKNGLWTNPLRPAYRGAEQTAADAVRRCRWSGRASPKAFIPPASKAAASPSTTKGHATMSICSHSVWPLVW